MDALVVRPAIETDLKRIAEIYGDAVLHGTATYEIDPPDCREMIRRFEGVITGGHPYLVAEAHGGIAGYAYAAPFRTRPAYRFTVEDSIYVARECQGQGVGQLLLARLIEETGLLGFRQMVAVIGDGSPQSPSVRLHQQSGFRHAGVLEGTGYKHGRWLDTVFMQLTLNDGADSSPDPLSLPERRHGAQKAPSGAPLRSRIRSI